MLHFHFFYDINCKKVNIIMFTKLDLIPFIFRVFVIMDDFDYERKIRRKAK